MANIGSQMKLLQGSGIAHVMMSGGSVIDTTKRYELVVEDS